MEEAERRSVMSKFTDAVMDMMTDYHMTNEQKDLWDEVINGLTDAQREAIFACDKAAYEGGYFLGAVAGVKYYVILLIVYSGATIGYTILKDFISTEMKNRKLRKKAKEVNE
jgi:hypothetical protein